MSDQKSAQKVQELQNRQQQANNKIIQYRTEHKAISEQLDAIWAEVKAKYGVDNLDQLRELYRSKTDERDQKIANAEKELAEVESILQMIDQEFSQIKA